MSASGTEAWHGPAVLRAKAAASAALGIAVVAVFFPLWISVPAGALLAVWGAGMCLRRPLILVDPGAGLLTVRLGPVTRRVRLGEISAIGLDRAKVTVRKADGTSFSFYAWGGSRLDRWLRVPVVAGDVAHAVSRAAAGARVPEGTADAPGRPGRNRPLAAVAVSGALEIAAVFFVRVSWGDPVMTLLGTLVAAALGAAGVLSVILALWLFLNAGSRRAPAA
jgi:hypothetical protein